jgi:uncharacterized protein YwgA
MATTLHRPMQPKLAMLNWVLDALGVSANIATFGDRKAVQKAVYLAQRADVDLGYRHGWYVQGPYSRGLARDYYQLSEALAIGESAGPSRLDKSQADVLGNLRTLLEPPEGMVLGKAEWLELLASINFLVTKSKLDDAGVNRVMQREKANLFPHIARGRQALRERGLLPDA